MIGFVVAMEKEANLFLDEVKSLNIQNIAGKKVYTGKYLDKDFVLIIVYN